MFRRLVVVAMSIAALAATGCAAGKQTVVKPSSLHPSLALLDADDANPFAKEGSKIEYMAVEMAAYDTFFKDAAILQATVIYAELSIKEFSTTLTEIATAAGATVPTEGADLAAIAKDLAGKKDSLKPEQLEKIKASAEKFKILVELLAAVPEKGATLLATGQGFVGSAQADFVGPNALKLPGVLSGLNGALSSLKDTVDRAPNLVTSLGTIVEALAALVA